MSTITQSKYVFVNAQEMARMHPETFCAPSLDELSGIKNGDHVKVSCNSERFWRKVEKVDKNSLTVSVDNYLIIGANNELVIGYILTVGFENIYDIINNS